MRGPARSARVAIRLVTAAVAAACLTAGCATGPQRVTKIVDGRIVVTRAISPEAYEHVARSLLYEEEERWDEATAELQRALPFDDEASELRAHLAELFVRTARLEDAAEQVERSLAIAPSVDGYLASAHLHQARNDGPRALEALRSAVQTAVADGQPEAIERAHLELADAQVVGLDVAGALETVGQLERAFPETIRGRLQRGALSWALGRLPEGEAALTAALDREPADIDARLLLAELQAAAGRTAAAKASFAAAIDRTDAPLQIAAAVAGWLVLRGDLAEAQELADRTTANAADVDALALASTLERVVKRPERALELAERAAKLGASPGRVALMRAQALAGGDAPRVGDKADRAAAVKGLLGVALDAPELVEARLRAAELLRDDGKLDEAGRALDELLVRKPTDDADKERATLLTIARSLVDEKRGDAARAARRLDDALTANPGDARLVLARAAVEDRRGEWQRALAMADKLLARDPRNVEALNFAGFVAADHGQELPRATRQLQAAVALSPGSGGIIDSLGWAYFRAGDLERAGTFLEQAGRLEPSDPEILQHLGDLYAKRNERPRALATYRRALTLTPPEKLARELNERVRTLEAKSAAGR